MDDALDLRGEGESEACQGACDGDHDDYGLDPRDCQHRP